MKTVFSSRHIGHTGQVELVAGAIVPAYEKPSRADYIIERVTAVGLGDISHQPGHDAGKTYLK